MAARLHIRTPNPQEQAVADKLDNTAPFNDGQGTRVAGKPTGAGAEAAEGIHGDPKHRDSRRRPDDNSSLEGSNANPDDGRSGSEPLDSNSHEHLSGYGGKGGAPKQSNDGSKEGQR
jgi:hypothetical protein